MYYLFADIPVLTEEPSSSTIFLSFIYKQCIPYEAYPRVCTVLRSSCINITEETVVHKMASNLSVTFAVCFARTG
jgi:hypothetical protein